MMRKVSERSPLRILEKSSQKTLGPGNLGVLIARAGVGKTAFLVHIGLGKIFQGEKVVHVSLEEGPEKVTSHYQVILSDMLPAMDIRDEDESRALVDRNRMILAYLKNSFEVQRLRSNLKNLRENLHFRANALIVDGLDFGKLERATVEAFKAAAGEFEVEIWFSALSHRHITEMNKEGIPYPCHNLDELFTLVLQLEPTQSGLFLRLLKAPGAQLAANHRIRLDPNSFFTQ
jgi:hypothetical protein